MKKVNNVSNDANDLKEQLKQEHGNIIELKVGDDLIYLKKPSRAVVSLSILKASSDPMAQSEVLIENCYIGGSISKENILNDVGMLLGLQTKVSEILNIKAIEVKNC